MPLARSEHAIAELDGKIWVLGGYPPGRLPSNLVQIYDPAKSRSSLGPRLPQPIHHTHAADVDGKIYVAGGRPPAGHAFEVYDPATDKWEKLPDMPTQRNHLAMVALNGKIIVAGGRFGPGAMAEQTDVVEIYDPATRTWTKGAPLPRPEEASPAQPMPAACSSSAARASGPTCWA